MTTDPQRYQPGQRVRRRSGDVVTVTQDNGGDVVMWFDESDGYEEPMARWEIIEAVADDD